MTYSYIYINCFERSNTRPNYCFWCLLAWCRLSRGQRWCGRCPTCSSPNTYSRQSPPCSASATRSFVARVAGMQLTAYCDGWSKPVHTQMLDICELGQITMICPKSLQYVEAVNHVKILCWIQNIIFRF